MEKILMIQYSQDYNICRNSEMTTMSAQRKKYLKTYNEIALTNLV